eukprot:3687849-Rhodomonas_salina.1
MAPTICYAVSDADSTSVEDRQYGCVDEHSHCAFEMQCPHIRLLSGAENEGLSKAKGLKRSDSLSHRQKVLARQREAAQARTACAHVSTAQACAAYPMLTSQMDVQGADAMSGHDFDDAANRWKTVRTQLLKAVLEVPVQPSYLPKRNARNRISVQFVPGMRFLVFDFALYLLHSEIKDKKPRSWYKWYCNCGFLYWISGCTLALRGVRVNAAAHAPPPVGSVLYHTGGGPISEHHGTALHCEICAAATRYLVLSYRICYYSVASVWCYAVATRCTVLSSRMALPAAVSCQCLLRRKGAPYWHSP